MYHRTGVYRALQRNKSLSKKDIKLKKRSGNWAVGAGVLIAAMAARQCVAAPVIRLMPAAFPAIGKVDERFQSYNIEMAQIIGARFWKPYAHTHRASAAKAPNVAGRDANLFEARPPVDLGNRRLVALAAALGPAYLRVSGTWANTVHFQDNDESVPASPPAGFRGVLTRAEWKGVVEFAKAADAKLVMSFAVNSAVRDAAGIWTSVEAGPLLAYTNTIGGQVYAAELFNEPNQPGIGGAPPNYTAQTFARDEAAFAAFAKSAAPQMKIAGPSDADAGNAALPGGLSAESLMAAEPRTHVDIFSYHFYPALSQRCAAPASPAGTTLDMALNDAWLARTDAAFVAHKEVRDRYAPDAPIWLTETAGSACGGTPWDATFRDTFRYLDQMGRLARLGVSAIFHNTLAASEYGLIDETTLKPRPDYWAALLWRRLMGTSVLDAGAGVRGVHVYAQCLRQHPGGVSILAINLAKSLARVNVPGPADVYALTATYLESGTASLNGKPLAIGPDNALPALRARKSSGLVDLAPTSIAFIAEPFANNAACRL